MGAKPDLNVPVYNVDQFVWRPDHDAEEIDYFRHLVPYRKQNGLWLGSASVSSLVPEGCNFHSKVWSYSHEMGFEIFNQHTGVKRTFWVDELYMGYDWKECFYDDNPAGITCLRYTSDPSDTLGVSIEIYDYENHFLKNL